MAQRRRSRGHKHLIRIRNLRPTASGIHPITADERQTRIEKAKL
jgi:hypothetical protein